MQKCTYLGEVGRRRFSLAQGSILGQALSYGRGDVGEGLSRRRAVVQFKEKFSLTKKLRMD